MSEVARHMLIERLPAAIKRLALVGIALLALLLTSCVPLQPVGTWIEDGEVVVGFRRGQCRPHQPIPTEIEYVDLYEGNPNGSPAKSPQPVWRAFRNPGGTYRADFPITHTIDGYTVVTHGGFRLKPHREYYVSGGGGVDGDLTFNLSQLKDDSVYLGNTAKGEENYEPRDTFDWDPRGCVSENKQIDAITGAATLSAGVAIAFLVTFMAVVTRRINRRTAWLSKGN